MRPWCRVRSFSRYGSGMPAWDAPGEAMLMVQTSTEPRRILTSHVDFTPPKCGGPLNRLSEICSRTSATHMSVRMELVD